MNGPQKAGAVVLALFILVALFGPTTVRHDPFAIDGERLSSPSAEHWLGTNLLGQDLYSQLVYGARMSLWIGLAVAVLSTALSALFGLLAGYSEKADAVLNGLANMLLVLPSLLLIFLVASFTGGGTWQLVLTLGLLTWPGYMRLIRASVLSLKEREFVKSAQLFGGGTLYILRKHLLPYIWPLVRTKIIVSFQTAVTMEAGLAFLGIGDPNHPSWGKMLQHAFSYSGTFTSNAWQWTVVPPAMALLLVTVALALLSEPGQTGPLQHAAPSRHRMRLGQGGRPAAIAATSRGSGKDSAPAIAVKEVSVHLDGRTIIHPLSFAVVAGSVTALIGESGSGKTTLARALYGLLPEEAVTGDVTVAGKSIYRGAAGDALRCWRDAAFIFQDPRASFNPLLKIGRQFDEVMRHVPTAAQRRRAAAQALREVQLAEHVLDRYPHELSGGMLSRALIAMALVNKPRVLIADEPTSALDPIVKREIYDLLIRKVREHHMTLLLITHDLPAALHWADAILLLQGGRLATDAEKEQFLHRYRCLHRAWDCGEQLAKEH